MTFTIYMHVSAINCTKSRLKTRTFSITCLIKTCFVSCWIHPCVCVAIWQQTVCWVLYLHQSLDVYRTGASDMNGLALFLHCKVLRRTSLTRRVPPFWHHTRFRLAFLWRCPLWQPFLLLRRQSKDNVCQEKHRICKINKQNKHKNMKKKKKNHL